MMTCVPKTENYSLTCSSGMKVTLDSCVLGAASQNGDAVIMSQNGDCRADYNASGIRFDDIMKSYGCSQNAKISNFSKFPSFSNLL